MQLYFRADLIDDVLRIAQNIKTSLETLLQEATWLDDTTREEALHKVSAIELFVGRYEDPTTVQHLLGELKNLKFIEGSYESNKLNLEKFRISMKRYYGLHKELLNDNTKPMETLIGMYLDPFYYLLDNNVYLPAGMLQPPIYHKAWPNSLKYGTLGYLLAHEFAHSVGPRGAIIDHMGHMRQWWSNETKYIMDQRIKCYVDFFNNYTVPEINRRIKGHRTREENIADANGLHTAFLSYRHFAEAEMMNFDSPLHFVKHNQIPGLELSPEQLFFVGAAQLWCSSFKVAHYWQEIVDNHTIDKYRVLGMLSNNEDFPKVFNCPEGSNMNPSRRKCKVW